MKHVCKYPDRPGGLDRVFNACKLEFWVVMRTRYGAEI